MLPACLVAFFDYVRNVVWPSVYPLGNTGLRSTPCPDSYLVSAQALSFSFLFDSWRMHCLYAYLFAPRAAAAKRWFNSSVARSSRETWMNFYLLVNPNDVLAALHSILLVAVEECHPLLTTNTRARAHTHTHCSGVVVSLAGTALIPLILKPGKII